MTPALPRHGGIPCAVDRAIIRACRGHLAALAWRKDVTTGSNLQQRLLIGVVREISDPARLRRLWCGGDPHFISSYDESLSHVFDDYGIDALLSLELKESGLTASQRNALQKFRDAFSDYNDSVERRYRNAWPGDLVIFADPGWKHVMSLAHEFIATLGIPDEGQEKR